MMNPALNEKPRKLSKTEELDAYLRELRGRITLTGWEQLTADTKVPAEIAAALITGRPELARLAPPRALSVEECKECFNLIATLIETNRALQQHAEETAKLVKNWGDAFAALHRIGLQIEHFAHFRATDEGDDTLDGQDGQ